jgi:hypothetical protein
MKNSTMKTVIALCNMVYELNLYFIFDETVLWDIYDIFLKKKLTTSDEA